MTLLPFNNSRMLKKNRNFKRQLSFFDRKASDLHSICCNYCV